MSNLNGRIQRLEQAQSTQPGGAFTVADWLQWYRTGQPELADLLPADFLEIVQRRRLEASEAACLLDSE
jgi:hypothetical protein